MASVSEVREKLSALLANQISLDKFEDWFVPYSWNIHKRGTQDVQRFVYAIEHALSEFDEDSNALRQELANAALPFALLPHRILWVRPDGIPVPGTVHVSRKAKRYGRHAPMSAATNPRLVRSRLRNPSPAVPGSASNANQRLELC